MALGRGGENLFLSAKSTSQEVTYCLSYNVSESRIHRDFFEFLKQARFLLRMSGFSVYFSFQSTEEVSYSY